MAKRSANELFEQYHATLVFVLLMNDSDFINELHKHDLLPGDLNIKLDSLTERNERSSYFLDNMIKSGLAVGKNRHFISLLTVMKNSKHDYVQDLAKRIEKDLATDTKCKITVLLLTYS